MPVRAVDAFEVPAPRFEVSSPVRGRQLAALPAGPVVVQFSQALTAADHEVIAAWSAQRGGVVLRFYTIEPIEDLTFLRAYQRLDGLALECLGPDRRIRDLTPLREMQVDLQELALHFHPARGQDLTFLSERASLRRLDLGGLRHLPTRLPPHLQRLSVDGRLKSLAALEQVPDLQQLALRSVSLSDLHPLLPLHRLQTLELRLGSLQDQDLLPEVGQVQDLEIWQVRGVSDLSALAHLPDLKRLHLQTLARVHALPDLSGGTSLRRLYLEGLRSLHDLSSLATAPVLEEVFLVDMGHLSPRDLLPLRLAPALRQVHIGLGSDRKNRDAADLLQLPGTYGHLTIPT